jgi:hypothetical protein
MSEKRVLVEIAKIDSKIEAARLTVAKAQRELTRLEEFKETLLSIGDVEDWEEDDQPSGSIQRYYIASGSTQEYTNMSTKVAAIHYVRQKGSPASSTEIGNALVAGGKQTKSKQFNRTLDNTLKAASERQSSEIVRVKGEWALKEWNK